MAEKPSKFMIGFFVTAGIVLAVATIVWLGASNYFQKGALMVTYFDESVQGLSVDSSVKYRGVDIGTVREIGVAPDNRLVEVVMKISLKTDVRKDVTARLRSAGLTGIAYIELDRTADEWAELAPRIDFPTPYPVILSRPSDAKHLLTMLDKIVTEVNRIDLRSMLQEVRSIAKGIDRYVNGPEMKNIMSHLDSTTAGIDRTIRRVDAMAPEGMLEDLLGEAKGTLVETRAVVGRIKEDLDQMKLADSAARANRMVAGLDRDVREITRDLKATGDNLQRVSENLDILAEKLRDDPSELLFSRPPPVSTRERSSKEAGQP
jgi:phospholipid/cholesterol/gamma-HCH transport system substrate-binding protein